MRRVRDFLSADDRGIRLVIALALAAAFVGTIWYWTRGALLYGADNIGVYQIGDFWQNIHTDYLIPSLTAGLFPRNPSAALYLSIGMDAFASAYASQFFARQLLRRSFFGGRLLAVGAISAGLYLVSPVAISYWYVGLLDNVFLSTSALFVVLGLLVKLLKAFSAGRPFSLKDSIVLGLAFGLAGPDSLPNEVRVIGITIVLFAGALVLGLLAFRQSRAQASATYSSTLRILLVSTPISALLLFYPIYLFVTSPGFNLHSVGSVASYYSSRFAGTSYNTILATLRLEGRAQFVHTLYYPAYAASPEMVAASFAWPVLALVVPTAAVAAWEFPDRWLVAACELIAIPSVLWETGSNPPVGSIHDSLVAFLPYGNTLLQTYSLTLILLSKFYPVLVAFAAVTLGNLVAQVFAPGRTRAAPSIFVTLAPPFDSRRARRGRWAPLLAGATTIALAGLVAASALPIYDGQVERTTWAPDQEGYVLPNAYYASRTALLAHSVPNVLLLPAISTYFRTSWGFNGANGFYSNFYYPAQFIVPKFYGQYALFVNSTGQNYSIATNPIEPAWTTTHPVNVVWGAAANHSTATSTGGLRYSFGVGGSGGFPTGSAGWVRVEFPYRNGTFLSNAISNGNVWVGLTAVGGGTGWWILGSGSNALVETMVNRSLVVDLLLNAPNSGAAVNGSAISSVSVQIRQPAPTFGILFQPSAVFTVSTDQVAPDWLGMMRGLQVSFIMIDSTIVAGESQPAMLLNDTIGQLASDGYLYPYFSQGGLEIYRLGVGT